MALRFRHVVVLDLSGATDTQVEDVITRLRTLPAVIPELRAYEVGRDAGLSDGNSTLAVVADFDDADGYRAYRDHPEHRRIIDERILPILKGRAAVQHERWVSE